MGHKKQILDHLDQVEQHYSGHQGVSVLAKALRGAICTDFYLSPYFADWWDAASLELDALLDDEQARDSIRIRAAAEQVLHAKAKHDEAAWRRELLAEDEEYRQARQSLLAAFEKLRETLAEARAREVDDGSSQVLNPHEDFGGSDDESHYAAPALWKEIRERRERERGEGT